MSNVHPVQNKDMINHSKTILEMLAVGSAAKNCGQRLVDITQHKRFEGLGTIQYLTRQNKDTKTENQTYQLLVGCC